MAKKSVKIAATYFSTIIISILLIGGIGYFTITKYLDTPKQNTGINSVVQDEAAGGKEYIPSPGDGKTLLVIYESEKRQTATCFVLARFSPADNKVVIMPLQTDIACELDGAKNTLYEFYRLGGTFDAKRAAEKISGVNIDKYLRFSKESFTGFSNFMGNVDYDIPYNLIFENPETGESTVIKSGPQILDANTLRKVLTYPNYNGGEEYRAKVVGALAAELINSGAKGILQDGLDAVFTDVINSDIETDVTRYDYDDDKAAIQYVLKNNTSPAQLVIPSGTYNENNCYVLDENFVKAIPRWFSIE